MGKAITLPYKEGIFNTGNRLFENYKSESGWGMVERLLYSADNGYIIEVINKSKTEVTFKTVWVGIDEDAESPYSNGF